MFGCMLGGPVMIGTCDLCHSADLEPIYEPPANPQGFLVCLCGDCGLVQSLPRAVPTRPVAARPNAKPKDSRPRESLRTEASLSLIGAHGNLHAIRHVLHVGAN